MRVGGTRYDVRMIETFEEARAAVHREMSPLIGAHDILRVSTEGREDADAFAVEWGVEQPPFRSIGSPLPGALTLVDKMTGFVQITARAAEQDRYAAMQRVSVG